MKNTAFSGIFALALMASPLSASQVQAQDIAVDMAKDIAGMILGEVFDSIFSGPQAVTAEEVQNIVSNGFNQAALDTIQGDMGGLLGNITNYTYTSDWSVNQTFVTGFITTSTTLQSKINVKMSHENFMVLIKPYLAATSIRLAFMSERRRYVQAMNKVKLDNGEMTQQDYDLALQDQNNSLAGAAKESLDAMANFFYEDIFDTNVKNQGCLYKYPVTPWVNNSGALGKNYDMGLTDRSTVTCRNYAAVNFKNFVGMTPGMTFMTQGTTWQNTDIQNLGHDDLFAYSFKKWGGRTGPFANDYHMVVTRGEDMARYARSLNTITKYPEQFGDIEGQALGWLDIIAAGNDYNRFQSALQSARMLGVSEDVLISHFSGKQDQALFDHRQWFATNKLSKWGVKISEQPTRIDFPTDNPYPTDAPAWIGVNLPYNPATDKPPSAPSFGRMGI